MGKHPLRAEKDLILTEPSPFTCLICDRKGNSHLLLNASKSSSVLGPKLLLPTVENIWLCILKLDCRSKHDVFGSVSFIHLTMN